MELLLKYWQPIVALVLLIAGYAALKAGFAMLKVEVKELRIDLDKLTGILTAHLSSDGIHFGVYDRQTAKEFRDDQAARSERIEQTVIEIRRELRERKG